MPSAFSVRVRGVQIFDRFLKGSTGVSSMAVSLLVNEIHCLIYMAEFFKIKDSKVTFRVEDDTNHHEVGRGLPVANELP